MDLVEAHRNQVSTLRDLVLSAGRNVSPGDVEDALSFNNGDEEMTYEYLMLLYADKDKDCNRDEKDDEKVVLCATKEAVGVVKTERDDELTAEEASYEMVSSLFKGSKVETEIETALLNHEFDTEATIMHLFALQEIMEEEEAAEVERVQRAGKKRRAKGHKLNLWTMGGGAELPSSRWAGNKALPMAKADHGKGREHGGNATIISGSGVARPFAAYEPKLSRFGRSLGVVAVLVVVIIPFVVFSFIVPFSQAHGRRLGTNSRRQPAPLSGTEYRGQGNTRELPPKPRQREQCRLARPDR